MNICIDPINDVQHSSDLVNIVSGEVFPSTVNVEQAAEIGHKVMHDYEKSLPNGFYDAIPKKIRTMRSSKKHINIREGKIYDTELIYSRVMGMQVSGREVDIKNIIQHELSPIPTALFEESGNMRPARAKSVLKQKLQVEKSRRTIEPSNALVIDGCALLWIVPYPSNGTVRDYVDAFIKLILGHLAVQDVFLVFDRYYDYSIKSETRISRAGKQPSRHYQLALNMSLPPREVLFSVTFNKVQLIDVIVKKLCNNIQELQKAADNNRVTNSLTVTHGDPVLVELSHGIVIHRDDMKTTHEEADVIIVQQVVMLSFQKDVITVMSDDTDVFLLLHHYFMESLTCKVYMEGTHSKRINQSYLSAGPACNHGV